jgi:hypothetical protein
MRFVFEIENIEEARRRQGIQDVDLRDKIGALQVGDTVKLTFMTRTTPFVGETLRVRITSIRGPAFRGKLANQPTALGLSKLKLGFPVAFGTIHIHSIVRREET